MNRAHAKRGTPKDGISLIKPGRRFWLGFWGVAILLIPTGVMLDWFTELDLDRLTLYGALVAAGYAGIQAYQARLDGLRPVLIGHQVQFGRLSSRVGDARSEVGLTVEVENVGPGPALQCRFSAWLQRLGESSRQVDPARDLENEAQDLKLAAPHFLIEWGAVGAAGRTDKLPWHPTLTPYGGPLDGDFLCHWKLEYRDIANRKCESWGTTFFESGVQEFAVVVPLEHAE